VGGGCEGPSHPGGDGPIAMPKKVRSPKQAEKYWVQPSDGVKFVRRDLSQAQVREAKARMEAGESLEDVVDSFYDEITGRVEK